MFIPIGDENPRETTPYVNYFLLGANIAAFFLFCFPQPGMATLQNWAMTPALIRFNDPPSLVPLVTSLFLHANLLHLAGNMLFLWIFGDNVEDRLGHAPYLFFYFLSGFAADGLHLMMNPAGSIPTLGASGAISGVIAAYVFFFPRHQVRVFYWFVFVADIILVPAWLFIGIWFGEQLLMAWFVSQTTHGETGGVAYGAHIGGFAAGLAMAVLARFTYAAGRSHKAGLYARPQPKEVAGASRWGDRSEPIYQPLVTVHEEDPGIVFVDEPSSRYSVLRMSDELYNIGPIASVTAAITGEGASKVARRLGASRGLIANNLPRAVAERVQLALRRQGLPTLVVPSGPGFLPPSPITLDKLAWDDVRLSLTTPRQTQTVPWKVPFLYLGAVVAQEPLIDVYVTTRFAVRVDGHTDIRIIDAIQRREFRGTLRDLATAIIDCQEGAAINDGIRVLAHRGSWGWLNFKDPVDFENYSFWLYNMILSQRPLRRYQR